MAKSTNTVLFTITRGEYRKPYFCPSKPPLLQKSIETLKVLQASDKPTSLIKSKGKETVTVVNSQREYSTLKVTIKRSQSSFPCKYTPKHKSISSKQKPDMIFPEDIEEYFHQGLLSQPQIARACTDQIIPDSPSAILSRCGGTQKEKLQIVPDIQSMVNVKVVNSTSKKASSSEARCFMKPSTGNERNSATKMHPKESKCSDHQLRKKTYIPSAIAIPETPKLKIKQYCSQHSLGCGSDNTVAGVPETPLLGYGKDTGLSMTVQ